MRASIDAVIESASLRSFPWQPLWHGVDVEFCVLGRLQVISADGRPYEFEPRQARLLAVLLLARGRLVSREYLIEAIWDGDPPQTAWRQLKNVVSALRRRLSEAGGADALPAFRGSGYLLDTAAHQLDIQEFEDQVALARLAKDMGQVQEASRMLRTALSLWRGEALSGLTGRILTASATQLDEKRLAALEERLQLDLSLGRGLELTAELSGLAATYPLRERFVGQYMLALHRSGRQAEALNEYQLLRMRLSEQLGIDPSQALQDLYTAILREETEGLAFPAAPRQAPPAIELAIPRQLPAPALHFAGRASEHKELRRRVHGAPAAGPVVCAIAGPGGIGKTTAAVRWAHELAERYPDGQVYLNLRGSDLTTTAVSPDDALHNILSAMQVPAAQMPASVDARVQLYRDITATRQMIVILDNARDPAQVRPLLPAGRGCLTFVTCRSQLTGLVVADGAFPIELELLSAGESCELLIQWVGPERSAADPEAINAIVSHCAGLPIALAIVAARATARPSFPLSALASELADVHSRLDALDTDDETTQLRALFAWSVGKVSPQAARLFRLLGLHPGGTVSAAAAASLAGLPLGQTLRLLVELSRANLIEERAPRRYSLHDLLRAYAHEEANAVESSETREAAILRILDYYLHTGDQASTAYRLNTKRIHLGAAQPSVTVHAAANRAEAWRWFSDEHTAVVAAVSLANHSELDLQTWQIARTVRSFLADQGLWTDLVSTQRLALEAATRLNDPEAQAYALRALGQAHTFLGTPSQARAYLHRALKLAEEAGDTDGQANAESRLAELLFRDGQALDAVHHARLALHLFQAIRDRRGEAIMHNNIGWYQIELDECHDAIMHCTQALELSRAIGFTQLTASTLDSIGLAHHRLGDFRAAVTHFRRSLDTHTSTSSRHSLAGTYEHLGDSCFAQGDRAAAQQAWLEALRRFDHLGHARAAAVRDKLALR